LRAFPLGEVFAKGGVNVKFVVALTDRSPDSTAVVVVALMSLGVFQAVLINTKITTDLTRSKTDQMV
jgi:hypothetical protein